MAAAVLRCRDPGLGEEGGAVKGVCLPFFASPFWEAVWMLQDPWQEMLNPWVKGTLQLSATSLLQTPEQLTIL